MPPRQHSWLRTTGLTPDPKMLREKKNVETLWLTSIMMQVVYYYLNV